MPTFGIVIHGGAGAISKSAMTRELERSYHDGLREALTAGYEILESGGTAVDAVQKAVNVMEDSPLFNAGRGAVFTHAGRNEMDAAIMDGATLKAGAVAGVQHIKNPINIARMVMEKTPHVLLAHDGAEEFARLNGFELMPDEYFFTESRWQQLQKAIELEKSWKERSRSSSESDSEQKFGTVGAVALDQSGNLAAATSTGGMTNSRHGRIGDSPLIGAGTYANNQTCAVSATGHGEYIIRAVLGHDLSALMQYYGMSLRDAAEKVIFGRFKELGGTGGLVAIDRQGNIAFPFNTPGMYRGHYLQGQKLETAIYRE